jgi:uncharacterized protein (TIGR02266 family)
MEAERRREPREPIAAVVQYLDPSARSSDYTDNVSSGGLFLLTLRDWNVGTRLRFFLSFPGLLDPIALVGIVRWKRPSPKDERGFGVQFEEIDARSQASLATFLEHLRSIPRD